MAGKYPTSGRWIKPSGKTSTPATLITVICESAPLPILQDRPPSIPLYVMHAVHVVERHRRGTVWSNPNYLRFHRPETFHHWLEECTYQGRTQMVYTPHVEQTLQLTDWFERLERLGVRLEDKERDPTVFQPVESNDVESEHPSPQNLPDFNSATPRYTIERRALTGKTEILRYRLPSGRKIQWHRIAQLLPSSDEKMGRTLDYRWTDTGPPPIGATTPIRLAIDQAHMWAEALYALYAWWELVEGGPWSPTVAGLGWAFIRSRLAAKTILQHHHHQARDLEQLAIHAGRRQTWYTGNIGSEETWQRTPGDRPSRSTLATIDDSMVHIDIRSTYPFLLSTMPIPIALLKVHRRVSPAGALDACQEYGVLARVTMESLTDEYPYRDAAGSCYPIGRYTTTLTAPELEIACSEGAVVEVHEMAIYRQGVPFRAAMEHALNLRRQYHTEGKAAWEQLAKLLSNSSTGRMAAKEYRWVPRPKMTLPIRWGCLTRTAIGDQPARHFQCWAGAVWERKILPQSYRSMAAGYATLVAYGRVLMRMYRQSLPPHTVVSMDTDGMWCLTSGLQSSPLYPLIDTGEPGELIAGPHTACGRFWGPQTYWTNRGWVLSGQSRPTIRPDTATIETHRVQGVARTSPHLPDPVLVVHTSRHTLRPSHGQGEVQPDGWILPPYRRQA